MSFSCHDPFNVDTITHLFACHVNVCSRAACISQQVFIVFQSHLISLTFNTQRNIFKEKHDAVSDSFTFAAMFVDGVRSLLKLLGKK